MTDLIDKSDKALPTAHPEKRTNERTETHARDCISRQAAIDSVQGIGRLATLPDNDAVIRMSAVEYVLYNLPSAQPKIEERMSETEHFVPNDDFISRKGAIDAIEAVFPVDPMKSEYAQGVACGAALAKTYVEQLPSAQPEIIRCGQCKYAEVADKEDAQDGYTCQFHRGSIWFSGSYCSWAERRTDERPD